MIQHHEEQFKEAILSIIAEGVMILDTSDIITSWNPAAASIFDITPSAMLGNRYQDILNLLPPVLASCLPEMILTAKKDHSIVPSPINCTLQKRGDVHLIVMVSSVYDAQGVYIGTVVTILDRTERLKLIAEVKRMRRANPE